MAQSKLGRNAFTVQESVNMESYSDWNYEVLDLSADETNDTSTYITTGNPAKKVVLYIEPTTDASSSLEADDRLTITLNGETDSNKLILIDPGDLPFTITGLLITSFAVQSVTGTTSDSIACLSFH